MLCETFSLVKNLVGNRHRCLHTESITRRLDRSTQNIREAPRTVCISNFRDSRDGERTQRTGQPDKRYLGPFNPSSTIVHLCYRQRAADKRVWLCCWGVSDAYRVDTVMVTRVTISAVRRTKCCKRMPADASPRISGIFVVIVRASLVCCVASAPSVNRMPASPARRPPQARGSPGVGGFCVMMLEPGATDNPAMGARRDIDPCAR